jgi:hypothetical protein
VAEQKPKSSIPEPPQQQPVEAKTTTESHEDLGRQKKRGKQADKLRTIIAALYNNRPITSLQCAMVATTMIARPALLGDPTSKSR